MTSYQSYVFNFSASYFGGGLKRILAYVKWFNANGGACFVLNERLRELEQTFPHNRYCFLKPNAFSKVFNYSPTLKQFLSGLGNINLYYSYNVPLFGKIAKVNWLQVANVLPFVNAKKYVPLKRAMQLQLLGVLIKNSMKYADVISAESNASLRLINTTSPAKRVVSVNGSDDEIAAYHKHLDSLDENFAVAVGTCQYKRMDDVYQVYCHLRESNPELRLLIAGIKEDVPASITKDPLVSLQGVLSQLQVCELLQKAKYYISATMIENSYNAASEGIFLARESYISDIGPHRELLQNINFKVLDNLNTHSPMLQVNHADLHVNNLMSWEQVIGDMIQTC